MRLTKAIKSDLLGQIYKKIALKHSGPLRHAVIAYNDLLYKEIVTCIGQERLDLATQALKVLGCSASHMARLQKPNGNYSDYHEILSVRWRPSSTDYTVIDLVPNLNDRQWDVKVPVNTTLDQHLKPVASNKLDELAKAVRKERETLIQIMGEANDLLAGINTDKQLADLWPEAAKLLPQDNISNLPIRIPERMREVLA